jgi:hypothetical protein
MTTTHAVPAREDRTDPTQYSHYLKDVRHLDFIDVYRVLQLWGPLPEPIQHAIKKLLCAGERGVKDARQDYNEAIASTKRALQMMDEDAARPAGTTTTRKEAADG